MQTYIVAGFVLGGIYAIAAVGLVLTYEASRVFNFGHGAMAFFVASFFFQMHHTWGWPVPVAAVVAIGIVGPVGGLLLWAVLFRQLRDSAPTVKLVATIGLYVAIPPLTLFLFEDKPIYNARGLAGSPPSLHKIAGVVFNADQLVVLGCSALVAIVLAVVLRYTGFGRDIRAAVDRPAQAELAGVNTQLVSAASWMIGAGLAGVAGILLAPIIGLDPTRFDQLILASFAAVAVARFRSMPLAFGGGILLGLAQSISVKYLPSSGILSRGVRPSIPFFLIAVVLLLDFRAGRRREQMSDRGWMAKLGEPRAVAGRRFVGPTVLVLLAISVPLYLNDIWVGIIAGGVAVAVVLLSHTVVMGEGGMISLCQITFAGIGAITTAQLATVHGWPVGLAVLAAGVVAVPFGLLIGLPALRLGGLYLALATLAFATLFLNMVFPIERFTNFGSGVLIKRPQLAGFAFASDVRFYYLALAVFAVCAVSVSRIRRSTVGLLLAAVRGSEAASATMGVSVVKAKLFAFGVSAFIAGIGGGMIGIYRGIVDPTTFAPLLGLLWLAAVVIWGFRSISGALFAGVMQALVPALFAEHLSASANNLVPVLFGLTAIQLAREPRGLLAMNAQLGRDLIAFVRRSRAKNPATAPVFGAPATTTQPESGAVPAELRAGTVAASAADRSEGRTRSD